MTSEIKQNELLKKLEELEKRLIADLGLAVSLRLDLAEMMPEYGKNGLPSNLIELREAIKKLGR
jgi:hypothetical protein